jgi:hypothetical protein
MLQQTGVAAFETFIKKGTVHKQNASHWKYYILL